MDQDPINNLESLADVVRRFELRTTKVLGQNFLLDLNLTRRIARSSGALEGRTIIEIGPGPGGLTRALLVEGASQVIALEKDPRCVAALAPLVEASQGRLEVRESDALTTPLRDLIQGPTKIVANLPYNIATPLIMGWLEDLHLLENMTVMVQKEVAQRFEAVPRTKAYGRVSVLAQWYAQVHILFDLPPHVFWPAPKVVSSVVSFVPHKTPPAPADPHALDSLLRHAFAHRRKVLRANLRPLCEDSAGLLNALGLSENVRAEELNLKDFCALSRML